MSALEYLNVMSKKLSKDDLPKKSAEKPKDKKQFKHGNNVILKLGTYKGYYGYVYDFFPSKIELEIEDQQYINSKTYGEKNIGETIMTEFGDSTILEKKNKKYIFNIEKYEKSENEQIKQELLKDIFKNNQPKINKIQVRLNEDDVLYVIQYKKNNQIRLGLFDSSDDKVIGVKPIKLNYTDESTKMELIDELSNKIKNNDFYISNVQQINKEDVLFPELFFIKKGEYAGQYATDVQTIPAQYLITYKKQIQLAKNQLKRETTKLFKVLSGPYKGKSGELIRYIPAHLTIYIDAAGKKVTRHMVKKNDGYIEREIYPSDVFYMDLLLMNGNVFEVKEITEDNVIIGLEKTEQGLIPKQITKEMIESLQPGFAFTQDTKEKMELEENVFSYGDPSYEEKEFESEDQDDEENLYKEFEESDQEFDSDIEEEIAGEESEDQKEKDVTTDEKEYKASYKDIERVAFEGVQLTKEQQKIKNRIEKITNQFGINNLNEYKLVEQIEQTIQKIKNELKNAKMNFWNISDEKYIIATHVLFEIFKSGFGSMISNTGQDTLTNYIENLITGSRAFFNKKDYINSIFAKSGWSKILSIDERVFKTLVNSKDQIEIHKYIMLNCIALIENYYGKVNLEAKTSEEQEIIALGKRKYEDEPKTRITIKDIFTQNVTKDANTILWGLSYQPLLEKYKRKLIEKINDPKSNKTTKIIYDYILQNIERGIFEIPQMEKTYQQTNSQLDKLKYEKLTKIWESLLSDVEIIYKKLEKEKQEKRKRLEKERQELLERRETISATKRLRSMGLEDEEEESIELKQERKYPAYLERMAKKYKL